MWSAKAVTEEPSMCAPRISLPVGKRFSRATQQRHDAARSGPNKRRRRPEIDIDGKREKK
jgi:hypothetical protein